MGGNNAFNDTWASQTDIGKLVGMSSVAVGKELTAFGLRDGGVPARHGQSLGGGLVQVHSAQRRDAAFSLAY